MPLQVPATAYDFPFSGDIIASETAIVVIDMQMDFCAEGGWVASLTSALPLMREPIEPIALVLAAARSVGMKIIYTREGHRVDGSDLTDVKKFRTQLAYDGAGVGEYTSLGRVLTRGEPGHQIIPELAPHPGDTIIDKVGSGCFYGTEMEHILRNNGIHHLVFVGVTTECCVHTSMREAADRGFDNLLLEDATASVTYELKDAAVSIIRDPSTLFGTVGNSQNFISVLDVLQHKGRMQENGNTPPT
ncbi:cysteine hydrolase family protein [Acetobacter conturbans]|uniref:Isochorismatase family protein n=1 Tax=Acetobacter conturbans TaxID=1737472 RepID=A0ABX0JX60_9PROT|nr:isochorismatase family cysteine hydrolase [Acetobacter conturbans]NHN87424.1 isochorismatase family protein [Acetobacter conturbans]